MTGVRTILGGRYELLDQIGAGGMATVWRARDLRLDRDVAVKLLRPQFAEDPDFVQRFEVEARNAASLAHPNVAAVFDTGVDGGLRFIVMELVDGPSVADILRARGALPPLQAADVAAAAARALAAAHRRGLVHRDVKPANILVGRDGRVRLADFGIARALATTRVTTPGTILGSIPYLSPEQARGEEATAAGDLFSLGVVLYEMLAGRLPWAAPGPAALAAVRTTEPPVPLSAARPDLPASLTRIVARAMQVDPAKRYASARSFAESLEAWARRNAATLPGEPDLADTAALIAAAAGGGPARSPEDAIGAGAPGRSVAAAAVARANPSVPRGGPWPGADPRGREPAVVAGARAGASRNERASGGPTIGGGEERTRPERASPPVAVANVPPAAPAANPARPGPPTLAPVVGRTTRAPSSRSAPRGRRDDGDRRPVLIALALLTPVAILALLAFANLAGNRPGALPSETGSPEAVVLQPAGIASPSAGPTISPAASPTPGPTGTPTAKPTPRPTPRPTVAPTLASTPSQAVLNFYHAVVRHDWTTATALWSPSMQQRYPPRQWLVDRFRNTTRITIEGLRTVSTDRAAGTASVKVTIIEYRSVAPSPRTFSGSWDLVLLDGRWLLDQPHF